MRVRELEDHTPESIDDDEEEEEREGAGAGNGGTGEAAGETCYSLKPKSPVALDTSQSIYDDTCTHLASLSPPHPAVFPLVSLFLLSCPLLLYLSASHRLIRPSRIVAFGYQTGHKLIPSNVLIR